MQSPDGTYFYEGQTDGSTQRQRVPYSYRGTLSTREIFSKECAAGTEKSTTRTALCCTAARGRMASGKALRNEYTKNQHYEGFWCDGAKSGHGKLYTNGQLEYDGNWHLDEFPGVGKKYLIVDKTQCAMKDILIYGNWKYGSREGYGELWMEGSG